MDILNKIITADTRREIIKYFVLNLDKKVHLRKISRIIDKQVNAVSRELYNLVSIGFLKDQANGRKKLFYINKDFLLIDEFTKIVHKTWGLGKMVVQNRKSIGNIDIAIITENFVSNKHKSQYDVDLLLVGEIQVPVTSHLIKEVEIELNREIKYTVMSKEEFDFRRKKRDIFIENILAGDVVILTGKELLDSLP